MNIALVLFTWFPYGGLQRDMLKILNCCEERGMQCTVFCMQWQGERPPGTKVVQVPQRGLTRTARRQNFAIYVGKQVAGKFDAVIGFNKMPGLDYYYAADSCFAIKAYSRRSLLYRLTPRCRQYLHFEEAVFGRDSSTIALLLSPSQLQEYASHYQTPAARLRELPPGIDGSRKAPADTTTIRRQVRGELGVGDEELVILQIGSGFRIKGVDRSLRAIAALPAPLKSRLRFILIGQDKVGPYRRLAQNLGLGKQFVYVPGSEDVPRFLQGADLLLHPAYRESAGMVILEAIVAGLPVLTTDTCGYAFHVEKAGAGCVCPSPFRQASLNSALASMLVSGKRSNWRHNGIRYGREEDLYHMAETVVDIMAEAAS